jgi:hypothetical protein
MENDEYENAWGEGEDKIPTPASDAVKSAAMAQMDSQAKEFNDAFESEAPMKPEPKAMSFKEMFAAERKAGNKTFSWKGKKYTTDLAKAKPKAKAVDKPAMAANVTGDVKVEAKPAAKADKSIYDDNTFPKNVINAVKSKLTDKGEAQDDRMVKIPQGKGGKPNLMSDEADSATLLPGKRGA